MSSSVGGLDGSDALPRDADPELTSSVTTGCSEVAVSVTDTCAILESLRTSLDERFSLQQRLEDAVVAATAEQQEVHDSLARREEELVELRARLAAESTVLVQTTARAQDAEARVGDLSRQLEMERSRCASLEEAASAGTDAAVLQQRLNSVLESFERAQEVVQVERKARAHAAAEADAADKRRREVERELKRVEDALRTCERRLVETSQQVEQLREALSMAREQGGVGGASEARLRAALVEERKRAEGLRAKARLAEAKAKDMAAVVARFEREGSQAPAHAAAAGEATPSREVERLRARCQELERSEAAATQRAQVLELRVSELENDARELRLLVRQAQEGTSLMHTMARIRATKISKEEPVGFDALAYRVQSVAQRVERMQGGRGKPVHSAFLDERGRLKR